MTNAKEVIEHIILYGTPEEKKELYGFDIETPRRTIEKKFKYFCRGCYPRYFKTKSAQFHDNIIKLMVISYYGENKLVAGFRGCAKTSLKKLFDAFVLLNDGSKTRKYIKVLTKDGHNSRQIVTDVYNLMVEVKDIYGDMFEKQGEIKHEETMGSFTMKDGRKYSSGTVGQTQRGHLQDAYRPDWIWFEDVEDRDSIRSAIVTKGIMDKISEAIDGLAKDGSYFITCNYISDQGTIEWFMKKPSVESILIPLLKDHLDNTSVTWDVFTESDVKKLRADADDFFGEYQCDPKRSENRFFDIEKVEADMKLCLPPDREASGVKYWSIYKPNHRYGQGSDHSEGCGLDANTLAGFDFTTGQLVYTYANNKIAPDLAALEFARVGEEFGNCLYAPEVNAKCGGLVLGALKNALYPNIYKQVKDDHAKTNQTDKLGWESNSKTKHTMYFEFRRDYNDGLIKIYDIEVLKEMKAYSNNDLNETKTGLITRHFDLLTAVVIAWQMRKYDKAPKATMNTYRGKYDAYLEAVV